MIEKMPRPRRRVANPIQAAVERWLASVDGHDTDAPGSSSWQADLLDSTPKRFTIYEPMALLPAGSFAGPTWTSELARREPQTVATLWELVLECLSKSAKAALTNLAVNEGIPLVVAEGDGVENVRRSPSGLRMLFGNFGPALTGVEAPSQNDYSNALWVSTKQNGIHQTWAPRWTMFSRGNVKEKARLLEFPGAKKRQGRSTEEHVWAVDLYAGIGYFVFCYASLGLRVLCWEVNPWSVEGLQRGARANRWTVRVVQGGELELPTRALTSGDEQIIVFLESNERAWERIRELQEAGSAQEIRHVNCGYLPTSEPTWEAAWQMTRLSSESRLHLHENVGVNDTEARRRSIQRRFEDWSTAEERGKEPVVEHVELVKTFAPGVWHCVFDVRV
ncbi:hypothetical protein RJ55_03953 [Drechmeria coniospora]|nr:hypothetical protein RJ55_03953 [Drechmeria coniospora]